MSETKEKRTGPSGEKITQLAELLREAQGLRGRANTLADLCGVADYSGYGDIGPLGLAVSRMVYHLGVAAADAEAFLARELFDGFEPVCICGGKRWTCINDTDEIPEAAVQVRCYECGLVFAASLRPAPPPEPEQPAERAPYRDAGIPF